LYTLDIIVLIPNLKVLEVQRWGEWFFFFSIYLIFQAVLGPGVYSASNRNEYQKQ
jgi:hypothetical protein